MPTVTIERVTFEAIDRVEPLWLALRQHHAELEHGRAMQPPDRSWSLRREVYASFLADPRSFVLIAVCDGEDVGYALVAIHDGPDDTWVTGDAIAEVESLSVLASHRGEGIGGALLDRVDEELDRLGIRDLQLAVVSTNADALRFYEGRGLRPRLVMLDRFGR